VKKDGERCKRSVAEGKPFCWQHSRGMLAKWHSLTGKQTVGFYVGVASLAATLLFGIRSLLPTTVLPTIHVQSSGDQSPNVVDNSGEVKINNGQPTQEQKNKKSAGTKQ
jgi:hypothetical protein